MGPERAGEAEAATGPAGATGAGPLAGVRVLALEQAVSMPFCSFALAEMGAEVIKIERPGSGDLVRGWDSAVRGLSTGFVWLNANKRDVTLDLASEAGREAVRRLAARCDVVLENFAPGVVGRLGLGPEELRRDNPRLVYCSLSGYGQDGPYRDVKAYDLLIQGESGILLTNGQPDAPAKVGLPITDLIGGLTAALGVVGALLRRERTGEGAYLDVAMLDSAVSWLGYFPQHAWHGGGEPPRTGMRHQYLCPYGPYLAADGRWVSVVVATPSDWERFCTRVVRRPEWLDDLRFADAPSRRANRSELEALVEAAFREEPADVWLERLQAAGLPHGEVRTIASVLSHPQLLARRMFVEATSPVGTLPIVRFPLGSPDAPRHIPALGEHSAQVLAEIGYPAG
ncbi:MAG TPA: CaiB/BaiF CoA-transferase family protein [Acidimicrobiales bacterium]|nr:CaiB/BaiF CoA-transferase family protein [Acidimicrobiales bacterium]